MAAGIDHVTCSNCGARLPILQSGKRLGRRPLDIDVTNICDTLRRCRSVALAAQTLGCSRAYIYAALKKDGITTKEVISQE